VNIHAIERFLGDLAIKSRWSIPAASTTGKKVLVVGSGPCGLSAAYHLPLLGHDVVVQEAGPELGGMMRYGIPEYRLPRGILDAEINRIAAMGVEFRTGIKIEQLNCFLQEHQFDAVFLAIGAQLSKRVEIPTDDAGRIVDALKLLANPKGSSALCLGRRAAVYGGRNTAMDAARTSLRLGARETLIVYRRDIDHMPAHLSELEEAEAEGVKVHWLRTIKQIHPGKIEVKKMALDAKGYLQPTGEVEFIEADALILALGQQTHSQFLKAIPGIKITKDGSVEVNDQMMSGFAGIFAGGDMITEEKR
jgi:NADPH-dependent glutamate synthase beta subunit-like oxidoreductase